MPSRIEAGFVNPILQQRQQETRQMMQSNLQMLDAVIAQKKQVEENKRDIDYKASQYGIDPNTLGAGYENMDKNVISGVLEKRYREMQATQAAEQAKLDKESDRAYSYKLYLEKDKYQLKKDMAQLNVPYDETKDVFANAKMYGDAKKAEEKAKIKATAIQGKVDSFQELLDANDGKVVNGAIEMHPQVPSGNTYHLKIKNGSVSVRLQDGKYSPIESVIKSKYMADGKTVIAGNETQLPELYAIKKQAQQAWTQYGRIRQYVSNEKTPAQNTSQETQVLPGEQQKPEPGSVADQNMKNSKVQNKQMTEQEKMQTLINAIQNIGK